MYITRRLNEKRPLPFFTKCLRILLYRKRSVHSKVFTLFIATSIHLFITLPCISLPDCHLPEKVPPFLLVNHNDCPRTIVCKCRKVVAHSATRGHEHRIRHIRRIRGHRPVTPVGSIISSSYIYCSSITC